jgi:hypothetical protein
MANIHPMRRDETLLCESALGLDQERARAALYALRDLLEAVPAPIGACDPAGLGALLGLLAKSLPDMDED